MKAVKIFAYLMLFLGGVGITKTIESGDVFEIAVVPVIIVLAVFAYAVYQWRPD